MEVRQAQTELTSSGRAKLAYHLKPAQHPRCAHSLSRETPSQVVNPEGDGLNCPESVVAMPIQPHQTAAGAYQVVSRSGVALIW